MYQGTNKQIAGEIASIRNRLLKFNEHGRDLLSGDELKLRRNELKMTQAELAHRFGVQRNTVARWENGVLEVPIWVELALQALELAEVKRIKEETQWAKKKEKETAERLKKIDAGIKVEGNPLYKK